MREVLGGKTEERGRLCGNTTVSVQEVRHSSLTVAPLLQQLCLSTPAMSYQKRYDDIVHFSDSYHDRY